MPGYDYERTDPDEDQVFEHSPAEAAVEDLRVRSKLENPDAIVGMCGECGSTQPDQYIENSPFYLQGVPPYCKFCGGVVVIVPEELQSQAKRQIDRSRGL